MNPMIWSNLNSFSVTAFSEGQHHREAKGGSLVRAEARWCGKSVDQHSFCTLGAENVQPAIHMETAIRNTHGANK